VSTPTSLSWGSADSGFTDLRKGSDSFAGTNGILAGFYTLRGESIDCVILLFEKERLKPAGSIRYKGTVASLDELTGIALPAILSWIANGPIGIVDLKTKPASGARFFLLGQPPMESIILSGSRLFIFEKGNYSVAITQEGFESGSFQTAGIEPGMYRSLKVELVPIQPAAFPGLSMVNSAAVLDWKEETNFHEAGKKFQSALGRFIISLPFSIISLGAYNSFWEAYTRSAIGEGALYAAGGATALSLSLSLGFIIDTAIKLVDVLHTSR
jgi:hypothetical protein